jgi:hypothetical protein
MRRFFEVVMMCSIGYATMAQSIDNAKWRLKSPNEYGTVKKVNDNIELTRGDKYPVKLVLRAYQDVIVEPQSTYQLSYQVSVEGPGDGYVTIFYGDKTGKWKSMLHLYKKQSLIKECDFTAMKFNIAVPDNVVKLRIDLRAQGQKTKVIFKDVELKLIKKEKEIALSLTDDNVILDGKLDDALWKNAEELTPFLHLGHIDQTLSVKSSAFVALKDDYLYVGYRLEEPNTENMKISSTEDVSEMENPIHIAHDDCIECFFSTDKKSYSHLIVNSAGVKYWEQVNSNNVMQSWFPTEKMDYSGDWEAKSFIGKDFWSVEMRIKLSALFGKRIGDKQTLFANFTRHRPNGNEKNHTWAAISGLRYNSLIDFPALVLTLPSLPESTQHKEQLKQVFTKRFEIPELIFAGKPIKIITQNGKKFKLGRTVEFNDKAGILNDETEKILMDAVKSARNDGTITVILERGDPFNTKLLNSNELKKLQSPEAFKLQLEPGRVTILGVSDEGILRGIATLALLTKRTHAQTEAELPAMTIYDAPRMSFRGWHISKVNDDIKQIIKLAYLLRFNKIIIRLHDFNLPSPFPFKSHPIGSKRYTTEFWIDMFNYARSLGLEPIPEFRPWGRVSYLKNMPGGKTFYVEDASLKKNKAYYRNLDVANPEAVKVVMDLQKEIIDTLKPKGFHIAMDEIHWGNTVTSPAAKAKNWKPSDWFVTAINYSYELFKANNVKLYIWGDMIDPGYNGKGIDMCGPELLARLPKDIAVMDWKYDGTKKYDADLPSIKMFVESGVETIGAPWHKTRNIPRVAHSIMSHNANGMCLTSWHPIQIKDLNPELIRSLGLMAYYSWSPEDCDLNHLQLLPDVIVHAAAYWKKADYPAENLTVLDYDGSLVSGSELAKLTGFPQDSTLDFINTPFKNYRGAYFKIFKKAGQVAALAVPGNEKYYHGTVINGEFNSELNGWKIRNKSNGTISNKNGHLKITAPSDKVFMRIFQDVPLDPEKCYSLHCRTKINGTGYGRLSTNIAYSEATWEKNTIGKNIKNKEWETCIIDLPAKCCKVRVNFSASGEGTTAWYDDVELQTKDKSLTTPNISIVVNRRAKVITFMHSTNKQDICEDLYIMERKFKDIIPGRYIICYKDNSKTDIPLIYRKNICAINDSALSCDSDLGLFGTIGERILVNIPTFTWINPLPDKVIESIEIMPGNSNKVSLLLFAVSID